MRSLVCSASQPDVPMYKHTHSQSNLDDIRDHHASDLTEDVTESSHRRRRHDNHRHERDTSGSPNVRVTGVVNWDKVGPSNESLAFCPKNPHYKYVIDTRQVGQYWCRASYRINETSTRLGEFNEGEYFHVTILVLVWRYAWQAIETRKRNRIS